MNKDATHGESRRLALHLLGRPQVCSGADDLTRHIKYRKGIALLGYLAANAGLWQSRESLADLFWPRLAMSAARTNLRQVLNNLANVIDGAGHRELLQKDDNAVRLVLGENAGMDIAWLSDAVLNRIAGDAQHSRQWRQNELEAVLPGLGSVFLDGLPTADMPEFAEWLESLRSYFGKRALLLLEHVCRAQHSEGRLAEAIETARLLVGFAAHDEQRTATLMTLLAEAGDGPGALEAFDAFRQRLAQETGDAPGKALDALRDDIRRGIRTRLSLLNLSAATHELRRLVAMHCAADLRLDQADSVDGVELERVATIAQQRGGRVISIAGQGLLIVFGLGAGVERSAQRALFAARDIVRGAPGPARWRIGICAGQVLFKDSTTLPHVLGDAPDLARCISAASQPGAIRVSESIRVQAAHLFAFGPSCEATFAGLDGSHRLCELADSRLLQAAAPAYPGVAATPFAGRREPMSQLQRLWREACAGRSRIAVLRAAAGLGKTRLVNEFARWVIAQGGRPLRIACRLELEHQPLAPIMLGLDDYARSPELDRPGADALAALGAWQTGDGLDSKSAVHAALIGIVERLIARGPTLLVIDDLHWSDLATRELLGIFASGLGSQKLLLVVTSRPETAMICAASRVEAIELAPMSEAESLDLVAACADGAPLTPAERRRVVTAGGGNPLFIEHLLNAWRHGEHHLLPLGELLQGELDRLGPWRSVVRAAAVLGGRFRRQDLIELLPDSNVAMALSRALAQGVIKAFSGAEFGFAHDLMHQAAYHSSSAAQRQDLHERAARLMAGQDARAAEEVARHFSAARCWREAAQFWVKAGTSAIAREFAADAQGCFAQALAMLAALGDDVDGEFARSVQLELGYAAQRAEGFGSPLAHRLFAEVAAKIEIDPLSLVEHRGQLFAALSGKYMGGSSQGEVEGLNIARRLEAMALSDSERLMTCFALGNSLFWRGELLAAKAWQQEGIALSARLTPGERIRYCVDDAAITCRAFLAWNLWFLGDEAAACAMVDEGVALARKGRRAHALCFVLTLGVGMHWCRGAARQVSELAGEALQLARRYGFPLWEGANQLFLLWAQASDGTLADSGALFGAAAQMQQAYQAGITTSRWIASSALMAADHWAEAERLLDLTIDEAHRYEDLYCLPDLVWRKGECLRRRGSAADATRHFARARRLAQALPAAGLLARFDRAPGASV